MLAAVSRRRTLVCLSTDWKRTDFDSMIAAECAQAGGTYVFMGDIFTNPANPDYQGSPLFSDAGVQRHPHDWSMAQISARIQAAVKP